MRLFLKERLYDAVVRSYYYIKHRKDHRKYVVLGQRQVGLGNRLIALANMYTWSGKENISLVWMLDFWVSVPFECLFEMKDAPGFRVSSPSRHDWSRRICIPEMPKGNSEWWQFWSPPKLAGELQTGKLFCAYGNTPDWARKLYGDFWRQLEPSYVVKNRILSCKLPSDVVCVMLRNSSEHGDAAGVAFPERFVHCMESYPKDCNFFISCMNESISNYLKGLFGDRVIELPHKNYKSMVDAVADMWILGHGTEMICQYGSTFTEAAWWWGGCKSRVTAVEQDYVQTY